MLEYVLYFRINLHKKPGDNMEKRMPLLEKILALIQPEIDKLDKHPKEEWYGPGYALTPTNIAGLTKILKFVADHSNEIEFDHALLEEIPKPEALDACEWFIFQPDSEYYMEQVRIDDALQALKADRMKGRRHIWKGDLQFVFSESLVAMIKENRYTGLEFVWAPDRGKFAAPQWHTPYATEFLGRGVDHPWLDPKAREKFTWKNGEPLPIGAYIVSLSTIRKGIETQPPGVGEFLKICALRGLRRVLRSFLPKTDFAYMRVFEGYGRCPDTAGTCLCVNAKVRKAMLAAGYAQAEEFEPLLVVDEPPEGAEVLDRAGEPLPGAFTAEQWVAVRAAEAKALAKFKAKPKPERPAVAPDMKKVIAKLKRRLKADGAKAAPGATVEQLDKAQGKLKKIIIPARWKEVLQAIDGFILDNAGTLDGTAELRVASCSNLPEEHAGNREMIDTDEQPVPKTHLGVASSDIGDAIFLDTAQATPDGDCPVLHIDHETLQTVATWRCIGDFLLEAAERSDEG